ncbi:hypothetical protein [Actinomadura hibisca]|uniref:hypothetical protein n=1 Tax=Actinomadura hibisca TaxID=68565 RepID=UPI000831ECE5|nr:hypothetical protein [Actinomadura hibisca]
MTSGDALVAIAQIVAGGGLVQAVVAVLRRRGELRQLDRQSESLAVNTADQLLIMLRRELTESRQEVAGLRQDRAALLTRIEQLSAQVAEGRVGAPRPRVEVDKPRDIAP